MPAVTLHDTTEAMGAIGICPGTQKCIVRSKYDIINLVLEDDEDEEDVFNLVRSILRMVHVPDQGDGFLYKSDTMAQHKGRGYPDTDDPNRVILLFLTFAEVLNPKKYGGAKRMILPFFGTIHALEWVSIQNLLPFRSFENHHI